VCFPVAVLAGRQSANPVTTKPWERILGTWKQVRGPADSTTVKVEPEGAGGARHDGKLSLHNLRA
jgi:hypothetical protein